MRSKTSSGPTLFRVRKTVILLEEPLSANPRITGLTDKVISRAFPAWVSHCVLEYRIYRQASFV